MVATQPALWAEPVRSIYGSNEQILCAIASLHCPEGFQCDMTFGNGGFWKTIPRPSLCFDITPLHDGVVQADSRMLPLESSSLDNAVFDPPFLTYVRSGRDHNDKVAMTSRFGGYYSWDELEDHYRGTLSEAARVLKSGGKFEGFRLADLFVLYAKHRMPGPQKGKQRHARIWHSYFLVLEKK